MIEKNVDELNELNFASMVLEVAGTSLVDFTAAWCSPCRALSPIVARIAEEMTGRVSVGSVDADANPGLAAKFCVLGLPTLIVFRDGREVARRMGLMTAEGIRALLRAGLPPDRPRDSADPPSLSATRA
jgi:thioredoxin 1